MRLRFLGVAAMAVGTSLWLVPVSGGDTSAPVWECRASAAYLNAPGADPGRLEPVVANGGTSPDTIQRAQCVDDDAGLPHLELGDPGAGSISVDGVYARTRVDPDLEDDTRVQTTDSAGGVARVSIRSADGTVIVGADVTEADATASCVNGVPTLSGTSRVVNLTVAGVPLPIESELLVPIVEAINGTPLVMLLHIELNEEVVEGDAGSATQSLTRRALHVSLLEMNGVPALEAVVGEARVDRNGAVCEAPPPPPACPAGTTEETRDADGSVVCRQVVTQAPPCPEGTVQAPEGQCVVFIPVGSPQERQLTPCPRGQVRDTGNRCRTIPRSRCPRSFARAFPIIGTNRRESITGTNVRDKILGLGGRDRISGGRGNDCIEGGSGNDNLDSSNGVDFLFGGTGRDILNGGTGDDRLFGGSGNDKLTGASGNDRMDGGSGRDRLSGGLGNDLLVGGSGKDYINTGNGRDIVRAGPGNDVINTSTAGPAARIDCGSGIDTIRINTNELRRHRNCERVLVATRSG
ncbi:MAG: calcium-binding protein [Thermoleophilaceae bacterium]